jgi:hypothetical protein
VLCFGYPRRDIPASAALSTYGLDGRSGMQNAVTVRLRDGLYLMYREAESGNAAAAHNMTPASAEKRSSTSSATWRC